VVVVEREKRLRCARARGRSRAEKTILSRQKIAFAARALLAKGELLRSKWRREGKGRASNGTRGALQEKAFSLLLLHPIDV
jgi:hypothetical protein